MIAIAQLKYLSGIIVHLTTILVSCPGNSKTDIVTVSGRQILVNDAPYIIKGICYHPVPKGSARRDFCNLTQDPGAGFQIAQEFLMMVPLKRNIGE